MYGIRVVQDHELPEDYDWAFVECRDTGAEYFLVKARAVGDPRVLAEGWAAYRKMDRAHTPCRQQGELPGVAQVVSLPLPLVSRCS